MAKYKDIPKPGAKGFALSVLPTRDQLDVALAEDGQCNPTDCWHYVAINALMDRLAPDEKHHVRVDAGHIKLNYRGWRYVADTPRHVKRSLMLFDLGRYNEVHVRQYTLRFRRTTKIIKITKERQDQINAARIERISRGSTEQQNVYNLRKRVEGFSGVV